MTRDKEILAYAKSFQGKGMENDELREIIQLAIIDGAKWADSHSQQQQLSSDVKESANRYAENAEKIDYPDVFARWQIGEAYKHGWMDRDEQVPRWKKTAGDVLRFTVLEDEGGKYIQHDGYKIYFSELEKLPKED